MLAVVFSRVEAKVPVTFETTDPENAAVVFARVEDNVPVTEPPPADAS